MKFVSKLKGDYYMAEISNMLNKNRMNLGEKAPLATPLVIQLEPSGYCNLECSFCPCGDKEARKLFPQDIMSLETFRLFIDQCKEFPDKIKVLRFIGIGEPLVNTNIALFVKMAKESGLFERVEITTNGLLITDELAIELVNAGLDTILISLESTNEDLFYKIANRKVDLSAFKEQLKRFYSIRKNTKIYIKTTNMGTENEEEFYSEYGEFCDYIYVESVIENWPEFSAGAINGAVRYKNEEYQKAKKVCIQPFKVLCLSANGDVMPCSVDWKRVLRLGNINTEKLADIWNGEKRNELLCSLLELSKEGLLCDKCKYVTQNQPDDIDDYREEIVKRIRKQING